MDVFVNPFAISVLVVFLTSIISGIFGMAGGLILMGCLSLVLSVSIAMIVHGFAQVFANGIRSWTLKNHIQWQSFKFYFVGSVLSLIVIFELKYVPEKKILFLLLALIAFLPSIPNTPKFNFAEPRMSFFCGVSVTLLQLTSGVAGPLLDLFFQKTKYNRHQIVATKAMTQTLSHIMKVIYFSSLDFQNVNALPRWLVPSIFISALLGTQAGIKILNRMTDNQFLKYTRYILICVGLFYFFQSMKLFFAHPLV